MIKKTLVAGLSALVLLAGCSSNTATQQDSAPAGDNRPGTAAPASASKVDDGVATFGAAYTWKDGLSVTVGVPEGYEPGKYAAGTEGFDQFVVFDVTLVNKTGETWDPVLFSASVQSGNTEGSAVFDSAQLPNRPTTKLLDGREVTFKMAFGVADPADIVMEVRPDFTHSSVIFQS